MNTQFLKKLTFCFGLTLLSLSTYAQCDKPVTLTSAMSNYLNEKGEVERSKEEQTIIRFSKAGIDITPGDHTLSGTVTDWKCNWTVPFKDGKTSFKSVLTEEGRKLHATILVEGKNSKVVLTFTADEMHGKKIQVTAVKFE